MRAISQRGGRAGPVLCDGNVYLFVGDYKYWFMADGDTIKSVLDNGDDEQEVVLNRALLYRDRCDFIIQDGDTGRREDYPVDPPHTRESP